MSDTTARLLRLLARLQSGAPAGGPDLAGDLGVTTRTVRRDVERLRALGYSIESEPGPAGGYRVGRGGSSIPPLMLDEDEALAVAVCLRTAAGGTVAGVEDAAARVLARLEQMIPARMRPHVAAVSTATSRLAGGTESVARDVFVDVSRACRERERLSLRYVDSRGRTTERRVEPLGVVNAGRRWYLAARDLDRQDWRTFRMDRIAAADATGHHFERVDPPDPLSLVHEAITIAPYRYRARIELHAPIAELAHRIPPTVGVLEALDDRTTILTTGDDDLYVLALHVGLIGVPFTVLEPDELRARFDDLAALLNRRG